MCPLGLAFEKTRNATMRTRHYAFFVLAVTCCLGLSATTLGQVQKKPEGPAGKADSPTPLRDLFLELDANGDRVIDRQEVPESGRGAFDTLLKYGDTNHDGRLEAEEYRILLQTVNWARAVSPEQRARRFKNLDKNGDGKLDRQEFPGGPVRFKLLDKNGDGFLNRDEIPWLNPDAPAPKAVAKKARD
jgi:Ca2+-binding EF-hand superfamily protein